ncbi:GATA-type domain-containing protein [Mycena chlorophos]|uniref:GATA-type domain-containing protein n=1 Tax=Mycena chlorophos TaxID=658473 RepID=A0A8H6WJ49_MYCCL|nr:GATA-type domain-containing protein [Mycena chlorophos]
MQQQPYPNRADPNVGQFSRDTVPHLDVLSPGFVPPQPQWSPHYVSHPVPQARYLPYPLKSEGASIVLLVEFLNISSDIYDDLGIPPLQGLAGAPPHPLQYIYSNYELSRTFASTSRFDPAPPNLLPNTSPSTQPPGPFIWNAFEPRAHLVRHNTDPPSSNLNVSCPKQKPKRRVPRHQHFTECPVCHRPAAECGQPRRGAVSGIMVCNRCGQYEKRKRTRRPTTLGNSVRISRRPRQPESASANAKGLGGEET